MSIHTILRAAVAALTIAAAWTGASAADYASLRREADASQQMIVSPGSACNRADEKFSEFIVKFTVDAAFSAERTKIAPVFALKNRADYRALVVIDGNEAGYYQVWQVSGPESVRLVCAYAGAPADYYYVFRRQDGRWFLTDRITPDF